MISDERLAEALAVQRWKGNAAPRWIAERIGALLFAGDLAGAARFRDVAARYEALLEAARH